MTEKSAFPVCFGEAQTETCKFCVFQVSCKDGDATSLLSKSSIISDGSSADYYKLPAGATELQDLISFRDMNAQMGEIFRACYRYGQVRHSPKLRDIKKIIFYAQAELARLEKLNGTDS